MKTLSKITLILFVASSILAGCASDPMEEVEDNYYLEMPATEDYDDEHPRPGGN